MHGFQYNMNPCALLVALRRYTLRYTGGMVPDVYHILIKSKGVFTNVCSQNAKAKLRLVYECAPIALLVEAAGGARCVCECHLAVPSPPLRYVDEMTEDVRVHVAIMECSGLAERWSSIFRVEDVMEVINASFMLAHLQSARQEYVIVS